MFDLIGNKKITDKVHIKSCLSCANYYGAVEPEGNGNSGIMILLDSPSKDGSGKAFWNIAGEYGLQLAMDDFGYCRGDLLLTGVSVCVGSDNRHYECCLANLQETIKKYKPKIIFTIGSKATGAVLRLYNPHHYTKDDTDKTLVGQCIPLTKPALLGVPSNLACDCWLVPLMSSGEISSRTAGHNEQRDVAQKLMYEYAVMGFDKAEKGRPAPLDVPKIELLIDTMSIVQALDEAIKSDYVAFDYETNRLDPYFPNAEILTASIAYGDSSGIKRTVAFRLQGTTVKAKWIEFLRSPVKKIGANIKFENTWSKINLQTDINNWYWDICIVGRVLDCERGKAGLKFITFSTFGVIGYDDSVSPYMVDDETGTNKLASMDWQKLLTYNAYDSAFTYMVCKEQHKLLGYEF